MIQRTRFLRLALLTTVVAVLTGGCIPVVPHNPRRTLVADLSFAEANKQLNATMIQSRNPIITSARVKDGILAFETTELGGIHPWGWYHSPGGNFKRAFAISTIDEVRVHENGVVYLYSNEVLSQQIHFPTVSLGLKLADLLMSFKADASGG